MLQYVEENSAATGADEFLNELYEEHGVALKFFVMRLNAGDRHLAEDIMQETMFRAWRNMDSLRESGRPIRPWLFTVARRLVIDAKRQRDTRPPEVVFKSDATADRFLEEGFEAIETRDEVIRALISLTPAQREIIIDIHYLGISVAEVAERMGIPTGTVKSRVYYALRELRAQLLTSGMSK